MMMPTLGFIFVVIFGAVTSQNHDMNLQAPYKEMTRKRSVEATTLIPPDPHVEDPGMRHLLSRLESLCMERLEYLITDTNSRFLSLENQSSVVHSTVNNIGDKLDRIVDPLTRLEKKLDNLTMEVDRMSQCCSVPAIPVVQNSEILKDQMENLSKSLQELMNVTRNLSSDVQAIKRNDSSLINITRLMVDLSSNSELQQIFNKGLQESKDLQTTTSTSCPSNLTLDRQYPRNCREVQQSGKAASRTYMIQPEHAPKPFEVVCDLETMGGGWTVIQRRFDGSQEFYQGWEDYKNGFGNLDGEFWLGLENIYLLTGFAVNELLIEVGDFKSQNKSAFYSEFSIGSEMEGYYLKVLGAYSGNAGDSLVSSFGIKFSTKDKDQDPHSQYNYAEVYHGAWWHSSSSYSNLNGRYFEDVQKINIHMSFWFTFNVLDHLKYTRMSVRPKYVYLLE